ncbi:MAG: DNA repair protein RecN [Erysipelotrichaceae bacterium]|nr:DNA repair protein RecN [Erysipelotrichaceae bacterium]MDY5997553.1 DNA repair protein RecN [Erysipelotrichaceae bacterium]
MLRSLYIKNFILVDELSVDFNSGFNVFTGETGAGKSIIINAISLLSNKRSSVSYIQNNKDKAIIEAIFDLNDNMKKVMDDNGIDHDEELILTREIKRDGKNTYRINHRIVTGNIVETIMQNTIDIHSQHDTQYLLNKNKHIELLDKYLNSDLCDIVKDKYQIYHKLQKELDDTLNTRFNQEDLDYFRYCIDEINNASLSVEEEDDLKKQEKNYLQVKNNLNKYEAIKQLYDESIYADLYEICKLSKGFEKDNIYESLDNARIQIDDAIEQLDNFVKDFYVDEQTINTIQERLFEINKLKHKYGNSIEKILAYKQELEEKVAAFDHRQEYIEKMQKDVDIAYEDYLQSANKLHDIRVKKALELEKEVVKNLKDLMLNNAQFKVSIAKDKASSKGIDNVEFMVSMNPGEQLKPLQKVASGGELSRLMLGLKVIFAKLANVETIIFDEIDTGVSGKVASAIGNKMHDISKDIQLFAITHLALVACQADHHYKVVKEVKDNNTYTNLLCLDNDKRIEEIALMASGNIDDKAMILAKELLQRS